VGAGDWEGMGIRIVKLLQQPERLKSMGAAGRLRVEKHFNVVNSTMGTVEVLKRVAAKEKSQRLANADISSTDIGVMVSFDTSAGSAK
jgi:hypothetical protein